VAGRSALHHAVDKDPSIYQPDHDDVAKWLMINGASAHAKDNEGDSSLALVKLARKVAADQYMQKQADDMQGSYQVKKQEVMVYPFPSFDKMLGKKGKKSKSKKKQEAEWAAAAAEKERKRELAERIRGTGSSDGGSGGWHQG
jgi:hypothetical protein